MEIPVTQLPPGDPRLIDAIVGQLKSKGIFDKFRKECLADVDTKPAFLNLRQRVDGQVKKFLGTQTWKNDLNKNQLRDGVRKNIQESGILDTGIDAIINQVVNPKIKPLILPLVEDTVYTFLQIEKPKREIQEYDNQLQPPHHEQKPFYGHQALMPQPYPPYPMYQEIPPPYYGNETRSEPQKVSPENENGSNGNEDSSVSSESEISMDDKSVEEPKPPVAPPSASDILPMETDAISSGEDDILARASPDSVLSVSHEQKVVEKVKMEEDNAVDSFDAARGETDAVATAIEKMTIKDEKVKADTESRDTEKDASIACLPLFDNRSLDSISSNTSGLSFSPPSATKSPQDQSPQTELKQSENSNKSIEDLRSTQSTPLVDEKSPKHDSVSSENSKSWAPYTLPKDLPSAERITIASFTPFGSVATAESARVVEGASPVSAEESQGSLDSSSIDKEPELPTQEGGEIKEPKPPKSDKSEGEITTSSSSSSSSPEQCLKGTSNVRPSFDKERRSKTEGHSSRSGHDGSRGDKNRDKYHKSKDDKERRHSKDSERRKSKSKHDDHSSHHDKDRHHRRDKDDDKDRDRHGGKGHSSSTGGGNSSRTTSSGDAAAGSKDKKKERSFEKSSDHKSHSSSHSKSHSKSHSSSRSKSHSSSSSSSHSKSHSKVSHSKLESKHQSKHDSGSSSRRDSKDEKSGSKSTEKTKTKDLDEKYKDSNCAENKNEKKEAKNVTNISKTVSNKSPPSDTISQPKSKKTEETSQKNSINTTHKLEKKGDKTIVDKSFSDTTTTKPKVKKTEEAKGKLVKRSVLKEDNIFELHLSNDKKDAVLPKPTTSLNKVSDKRSPLVKPEDKAKSSAAEAKSSAAETKSAAAETKSAAAETKSAAAETKSAAAETKSSTTKTKSSTTKTKLSIPKTNTAITEDKSTKKTKTSTPSIKNDSDTVAKRETRELKNTEDKSPSRSEITVNGFAKSKKKSLKNNGAKSTFKNREKKFGKRRLNHMILSSESSSSSSSSESSSESSSDDDDDNNNNNNSSNESTDDTLPVLKKVTIPLFNFNDINTKNNNNNEGENHTNKVAPLKRKRVRNAAMIHRHSAGETNDSDTSNISDTDSVKDLFGNTSDDDSDFEGFVTKPKTKSPPRKSKKLSSPKLKALKKQQLVVVCDSDSADMELSILKFCQNGKTENSASIEAEMTLKKNDFEGFNDEGFEDSCSGADQRLKDYLSKFSCGSPIYLDDFISYDSDEEEIGGESTFFSSNKNTTKSVIEEIASQQNAQQDSAIDEIEKSDSNQSLIPTDNDVSQTTIETSEMDSRKPLKKRKLSEVSSSGSMSSSPPKTRRKSSRLVNDKTPVEEFISKDLVMNSYALLTPEEDRTSSKDYEVDLSRRETSYSPLSPASDSSAEEIKPKLKVNAPAPDSKTSSCPTDAS